MRVRGSRRLPVPPAKITPFTSSSSTLHDGFGALRVRDVLDRACKRYPIHWSARCEDPPHEADDDDRSDREHEPSGRELSTTFGRCEGDCGQDRDSEGERQRVATLPEVTAGIL